MNGERPGIRRLLAGQALEDGFANAAGPARISAARHRWGSTDDGWFVILDGGVAARAPGRGGCRVPGCAQEVFHIGPRALDHAHPGL
ncbi:hypothetical protein [Pseudarthrobacter sp. H2]|uniref:hypothetical protein n=1 Tax=Pseudarthrobacter sp. H2 TaxID=3418415 RepID=UPI003CF87C60